MDLERVEALWSVARRGALLEYPCHDSSFAAQGSALVRVVKRLRQEDRLFLEVAHLGASDGYYAWYADAANAGLPGAAEERVVLHLCPGPVRRCRSPGPPGCTVIHVPSAVLVEPGAVGELLRKYSAAGGGGLGDSQHGFVEEVSEDEPPPTLDLGPVAIAPTEAGLPLLTQGPAASPAAPAAGDAKALDMELDDLDPEATSAARKENLKAKLEELRTRLRGGGTPGAAGSSGDLPSAPAQRDLFSVMTDRNAAAAKPPPRKRRRGLAQALKDALRVDDGEASSGGEESDEVPSSGRTAFMARRGTFRKTAREDPGRLTVRALA